MNNNTITILFLTSFFSISIVQLNWAQDVTISHRFSLIEATMTGNLRVENDQEKLLCFKDYYTSQKYVISMNDAWAHLRESITRVHDLNSKKMCGFTAKVLGFLYYITDSNKNN